jgi:outer membrane protein TolC
LPRTNEFEEEEMNKKFVSSWMKRNMIVIVAVVISIFSAGGRVHADVEQVHADVEQAVLILSDVQIPLP